MVEEEAMDASLDTILVTGATGQQGGAVIRHLKGRGFRVRALTRDPNSEKARLLSREGFELVQGDMEDRASLAAALKDSYGVFAMATPFEQGMDHEVAQGIALGDAAKAAGVRHYVYSSVGAADRDTGIPHFVTKARIEEHLRSLDLPLTILRPVWFFENFGSFAMQPADGGYLISMPLSSDRTLQGIAVDDVAAFVVTAFGQPEEWIGREIELAGDELTLPQYADLMSRTLGHQVRYQQVSIDTVRDQNEDFAKMYEFFERQGYQADIPALRRLYPGLQTFEQWLDRGGLRALHTAAEE
jgi:uncharacterized protein YbjT (DUF2867 family)